jgi:hypothetical protein
MVGEELFVTYKGEKISVEHLDPEAHYSLKLPEFKEPSLPRVMGKDIVDRIVSWSKVEHSNAKWSLDRKDIEVVDSEYLFDPYKNKRSE